MKSRVLTTLAFLLVALLLTACPPSTQMPQVPTLRTNGIVVEEYGLATQIPGFSPQLDQNIDYSMYPPGTVFYVNEDGTLANTRIVPELSQPEWDALDFPKGFSTTLVSGHWKKFQLGPTSLDQGYLVDVTPLEASSEGAEVVSMVMPEYDGESWVDVLWLFQPMEASPLPVYVQVYTTAGWPVAYYERLYLEPGIWQGYVFSQSSQQGAYVVKVSPQNAGKRGDTLQRYMVNPEFPGGWQETLRIQTLPDQAPLRADVTIYRTPLEFLKTETTLHLRPGKWALGILGPSEDRAAYVMEVTPLSSMDNQVESYGVEPVFMDGAWRDIFRVKIPADRPPMDVNVRVYAVTPNSRPDQLTQVPTITPDRVATELAAYIFANPTATLAATATQTPSILNPAGCPGALPSRLQVGQSGTVSLEPPIANRVRSQPSRDAEILGQMMPGEKFTILDGPRCADGWTWWRVRSRAQSLEGWTAEGNAEEYWLVPFHADTEAVSVEQNLETLTADQIVGANDIEAAIQRATKEGTRPGTVILDGRKGPFIYTVDDRSINIFVSNLTLRGVNQAVIKDCKDGLFFDDFPLKNIRVEGIEFICDGSGVVANGAFENVTLQNNIFQAGNSGIDIGGASTNWLIKENVIEAVHPAVVITGAHKITLTNNHISGNTGVTLRQCSETEVYQNIIQASDQGVWLAQESWKNMVQMNTILGVSRSGIALESGVTGNQILDNFISCAPGSSCVAIDVTPETEKMNTIRIANK
jgi:hypothetical protein